MESIQINLTTGTTNRKELNIGRIIYKDNSFVVEILDKSHLDLYVGQTVYYERKLYKGNGEYKIIRNAAEIIEINNADGVNNAKIAITLPPKHVYKINNTLLTADKNLYLQLNDSHDIYQQDIESFNGATMYLFDSDYNFLMSFSNNFFAVPNKYSNRPLNIYDCIIKTDEVKNCHQEDCDKISVYEYVFAPNVINDKGILILNEGLTECLKNGNVLCDEIQNAKYVTFKFNPFFYQSEEGIRTFDDIWRDEIEIIEDTGYPIKIENWSKICGDGNENENDVIEKFDRCIEILSYDNNTSIVVYDNSYKMNLNLLTNEDCLSLGSEDTFSTSFVNNIIEESIPKIIDMERIKYSPCFIEGNKSYDSYYMWYNPENETKIFTSSVEFVDNQIITNKSDELKYFYEISLNGELNALTLDSNTYFRFSYEYGPHFKNGVIPTLYKLGSSKCTYYLSDEKLNQNYNYVESISFYLHFLKRAQIKDEERLTANTLYTSGNVYYDTWHIDKEYRDVTWWNEYNYYDSNFDLESFKNFHVLNGKKSDLIGYLNFTDNDIYYRKRKVSQSFLRLSFYTSKDPYTQKLLYYSTIFLDDGELYGKYIKLIQNSEFKKAKEKNNLNNYVNNNAFSVLYSGDSRVDSQICVTNEYDRTKSSEGFNIYLFAEDKTFEMENNEKTIYMKIEFNHAGNGKTIPLIMWPKDNENNFCALTTDNFFDALYIPVKLAYINGRYVYSIIGSEYDNNEISVVLYEPKLDVIQDINLPLE